MKLQGLTDAQTVLLLEAVDSGSVYELSHTNRRPLARLVNLGLLRAAPAHLAWLLPTYTPTARGRAAVRWSRRLRQPIKPFVCPPGGTILPYRRPR
jgi:hypothetical protein